MMMKDKEKIVLEFKEIKVPSVAEIAEKEGISWEEAAKKCIIICGNLHKENNIDCLRKIYGQTLCTFCPKYHRL
jgi:hypothetical protein